MVRMKHVKDLHIVNSPVAGSVAAASTFAGSVTLGFSTLAGSVVVGSSALAGISALGVSTAAGSAGLVSVVVVAEHR